MTTTTTTTTPRIALIDPWVGCVNPLSLTAAVCEAMAPIEVAPTAWFRLREASRARLGGLGLAVLADNPAADVHRLVALVQLALRASYTPIAEMGMSAAEARYPSRFFVEDDDERQVWRAVETEIHDPEIVPQPQALFRELVEKLRSVGGLEATLLKRRAGIDAQLERLRTLRRGA